MIMKNFLSSKKSFFKEFFLTKLVIIFIFFLSLLLSYKILEKNDIYTNYQDITYHKMIKADPHRYLSHGAEIKKEVEEGNNFFLSGRENYTKYLPPRLAALYYILFDKDLFNNFEEKKINIGIHEEYLTLQCLFYFLSVFFLFNSIKRKFNNKIVFILVSFLCIEPTLTQYNFSFWSESIFFGLQIIILALLLKKNQNLKNLILIGFFISILSLQRQIAFFYIVPITLYYLIYFRSYFKIISIIFGYTFIQLSLGYINFLKFDNFHVMTADSKIEIHRSFVAPVVSRIKGITTKEFNYDEGVIVKKWIDENDIKYSNEEKFLNKDFNFVDWMDYRREIVLFEDKIKFDNYIKSRSYNYFINYPEQFLKHYLDRSMHVIILNPFHIYNDMKFISGEIMYESNSHKKYILPRTAYTFFIYIIALMGLIYLIKKKEKKILLILIFSIVYFFGLVGWSGNTRYFVPNMIYISVLFSFGLNSFLEFISKK